MTIQEFTKALNRFYEGKNDNIHDLSSMLSIVRKYFLKCYDDIDEGEFAKVKCQGVTTAEKKDNLRKKIDSIIKLLNRRIKASSNIKLDFKALYRLNDFFFDDKGKIRDESMVSEIKINTDFYRMRSTEGYTVYKRKDIFQIASENRKLASKLRFSDDGHPCLYLGASLYIAWEEVRRASFETVNFAMFRNTKKLRVLDLTIRKKYKKYMDFIMSYLCLLTSAKVEDGDKYKYRYEVSGLLMKLLQNSIAHKGDVDGIKYVSSRKFDGADIEIQGESRMIAYVFPPKEAVEKGVDKWLKDTFEVSAVRTTFLYNVHQINLHNPKVALTTDYQDTLFYQLEQQLKKEKFEKVIDK